VLTSLGPLLVLGGFLAYFAAVTKFALFERVPWAFLLVMSAGLALSVRQLVRGPSLGRGVGMLASIAFFGLGAWYLFGYSMSGTREDRPNVGDPFPSFALATADGGTFRLEDGRGRYLMLLFYRGDW
jgi:AhpC/TSA family